MSSVQKHDNMKIYYPGYRFADDQSKEVLNKRLPTEFVFDLLILPKKP